MLVDGVGIHKGFSQMSLTISQLIQGNFEKHPKNRRKNLVKSQKKCETPVLVYNSLKLYSQKV